MMYNKHPYTITEKGADYLAKIVETVTRLEFGTGFNRDIRLHRQNRLRTIHSSLAIEGNTLSLPEVTAVIEGQVMAGKQTEIKEVQNAYEAYDQIMTFSPYSVKDFLKAHKLMTDGLVKEAGKFRSGDAGVFNGDVAIHIGARPQIVPQLIEDLFASTRESELHQCLKSAILHYDIETIHPFADGNGRMGRLWQTLILAKWNAVLAWIPMESVIYENRPEYYETLYYGQHTDDSSRFIEFTLKSLLSSLQIIYADLEPTEQVKHQDKHQVKHQDKHQVKHQDKHQVELTQTQMAVLKALEKKPLSRKEIFTAIGMSGDSRAFKRHFEPLLEASLIKMTIPDKPNSRNQKYVRV
jgi:Fic family protein